MAISDGSGGAPNHADAFPRLDKRGVSRRSVLVGGAALLVGAGLMKPARALATPTGAASGTTGSGTFGLSPAQQAGQRVIWSYPGLTPPQALLDAIRAGLVGGGSSSARTSAALTIPARSKRSPPNWRRRRRTAASHTHYC